jgi:hypothetical protein
MNGTCEFRLVVLEIGLKPVSSTRTHCSSPEIIQIDPIFSDRLHENSTLPSGIKLYSLKWHAVSSKRETHMIW